MCFLLWDFSLDAPTQQVLGDPTGRVVAGVTSATEAAGKLYLGSIAGNGVQVVDLAAVAAATAQS